MNNSKTDNDATPATTYRLNDGQRYLIAWTSSSLERSSEIHIYGNPDGLRDIASKLIQMAELEQSKGGFPDGDSEHHHYKIGGNTEIASTLPLLTIGRVDSKHDPATIRDCFPGLLAEPTTPAIS